MEEMEKRFDEIAESMQAVKDNLATAGIRISAMATENVMLLELLKECGNELCLKCKLYRDEHLGACNECRWKNVKRGELPA